jgi:hypothetical protein
MELYVFPVYAVKEAMNGGKTHAVKKDRHQCLKEDSSYAGNTGRMIPHCGIKKSTSAAGRFACGRLCASLELPDNAANQFGNKENK